MGLIYALAAYLSWGLVVPVHFRLLDAIPPGTILAQRIAWSALLVTGLIALLRKRLANPFPLRPRHGLLVVSAGLIAINWMLYLVAVSSGHMLDASLGYFINPLVSVLLGVFVLKERLNAAQWCAVSLAALGVLWLTVQVGSPPWIAIALALSFGAYGLIRKKVVVDSVAGLGVETLLIAPVMLVYLAWTLHTGSFAFGTLGLKVDAFLVASGAITAIPLVLFAYGVRRVPLSTIGILQYLGPSLQLITGVFVFHEPFTQTQLIGFGLIWAALLVYAGEGLWRGRQLRRSAALAESGAPAATAAVAASPTAR